jgi:fructose-1,6-bisphosphatase/inositol monophosphatase family enzyme
MDIDTARVADIIRHVAATEVMPRFRNLQQSDIREKNPGDLVTVADEAAEKQLTQLLQEVLPEALVVGEEAVSKDTSVLHNLKGNRPVWVIDPVDGTSNFAKGSDKFGILIALMQHGVTEYGWIFDVPGNRMAITQRGAGSFLDGERLSITCKETGLKQLAGQCDGAPARHFDAVRPLFREIRQSGCCLHDHMDFITAKADFIAYVDRVTPWDHAAVNLLTREAGAYAAMDENGVPYDPTRYGPAFMLTAPTREWWEKLHPVLYSQLRTR